MDRLGALGVFVEVAERGGFAAAGRALGMSAPSVTRAIAGLEDGLGVKLLVRTTRTVKLTQAGARYLHRARRLLADAAEMEREVRAESVAPIGRFAISAPTMFGRREVAPVVNDLVERHPAVTAELVLGDRFVDLVDEGIDVAVRIGVLADSGLRARVVGATRRVVVGSPAYLARGRRIRTPADLGEHPVAHVTPLGTVPVWSFVRGGRGLEVPVRPTLITNSPDVAIAHAVRGLGLTMVLGYQVRELIEAGTLEVVLPGFEPPPVPIQLVFAAERQETAVMRAFVSLVLARDWRFVTLRPRRG